MKQSHFPRNATKMTLLLAFPEGPEVIRTVKPTEESKDSSVLEPIASHEAVQPASIALFHKGLNKATKSIFHKPSRACSQLPK